MSDVIDPKAPIERLDWRSIINAKADAPADLIATLDTYFEPFAQPKHRDGDPSKELICIECDKPLTGIMSAFFGGGFEWGISHGEGHCAACRWPARAHHSISDDVTIRNFVLQYHPDFVERRKPAA